MSGGVLFSKNRNDKNSEIEMEDVWDDTELIKMYEESVSAAYQKLEVAEGSGSAKWTVGDRCYAKYSEDGDWYLAKVTDVPLGSDTVKVSFDGYDTVEVVPFTDIMDEETFNAVCEDDEETEGEDPVQQIPQQHSHSHRQPERAEPSSSGTSNSQSRRRSNPPHPRRERHGHAAPSTSFRAPIPHLAPPPPPSFSHLAPPTDQEALSSMLMSWYMSGYHTGYYQALSDMKRSSQQ